MKTKAIILLLVVLSLLAFAAPAMAAPAAANDGLKNAHCKTMGTPGHKAVPFECSMDMMGGMMMDCGMMDMTV